MRAALAWLTVGLCLVFAPAVQAGKFNRALSTGDPAPGFADLPGVDDRRWGLADFGAARVVVVCILCNQCPCVRAYEDRLISLQQQYRSKGVRLIAINPNHGDGDTLPKMKQRVAAKPYPFPYVQGAAAGVAESYGALVTPTVFVLDGQRRVAYMGAIDDSRSVDKVSHHYLRDAIDAVLAGTEPEHTETRPIGCPVDSPDNEP